MKPADVCLIVEGGYPYVLGGVAFWVDALIRSLPQFRFHIVAIRISTQKPELRFELPSNVVGVQDIVLDGHVPGARARGSREAALPGVFAGFRALLSGENESLLQALLREIVDNNLGSKALLDSREAWCAMEADYEALFQNLPLLDFFWAWRFLLRSVINIAMAPLPNARLYHSVSTGYAGLFGVRAKIASNRPLLLTEHGIYTNERRMELCSADWIFESGASGYSVDSRNIELRDVWTNAFLAFSRAAYASADAITAQYRANQQVQLQDGALSEKLRLIPNGVNYDRLCSSARIRSAESRPTILMVARIVPIKDVRTFILAAEMLAQIVPDVEAIIIGPEDEDQDYAAECRSLVRQGRLERVVTFEGRVPDIMDYYPRADVFALTSISEAQPLALLEAGAAGLPIVTTDVGSCREILGLVDDPDELEPGGFVVPPGDPRAFAEAAAKLLLNPSLCARMGAAMRERVGRIYNQTRVRRLYADFYEEHLGGETSSHQVERV
jgi:polysaccharide biosynthesis protein PelF